MPAQLRLILCLFVLLTAIVFPSHFSIAAGSLHEDDSVEPASSSVNIEESKSAFVISNGLLTAQVSKQSGDLRSLRYKGTELLNHRSGHGGGYWSHDTVGGSQLQTSITIDPSKNGGQWAEVSVKGISGGKPMGHGPGTREEGDFLADVEIRYAMRSGDTAIYTYCIFDHAPEYGSTTLSEARFAVKLANYFDWISVDEKRNRAYPKIDPQEDKYCFTALQSIERAYGFASTQRNLGFYLINPSAEYLSGGPTKPEFLAHRDTTRAEAPVLLNYWRSSHYGGANVSVKQGESWSKVIGPFLMYVNEGDQPTQLWEDAKLRAKSEMTQWPYAWVDAAAYAKPDQRTTVAGQLQLDDPRLEDFPGEVWVGLVHADYKVAGWQGPNWGRRQGRRRGRQREISWQTDGKYYQFWAQAKADGRFEIPHVIPSDYKFVAMADGVLGQFSLPQISAESGKTADLGTLSWTPKRFGQEVWHIGVPNRSSSEFAGSDRHFQPGITLQYAKMFPDDVHFTIGESSERQDWFYAHVPHNTDPSARVNAYHGVTGSGRATPYTIHFKMDQQPQGTATLRLAICGTSTRALDVSVNGQKAGRVPLGISDGVINKHQIQGLWYQRELHFDASLLSEGENTLVLTVPAGPNNNGVVYDYLRLELDSDTEFTTSSTTGSDDNGAAEKANQQPSNQDRPKPPPTNTDESAVRSYTLPDPLTTVEGEKVTTVQQWESQRRPQLLELFAEHQFGRTPTGTIKPSIEVIDRDVKSLKGKALRSQVRIRFGKEDDSPMIRVLRYVPANAEGPVPTLLYASFSPNVLSVPEEGIDEGMAWNTRTRTRVPDREAFGFGPFDVAHFLDRGYGIALVYYGDIEPDFAHDGKHGVRSLFAEDDSPTRWGSIGGWSWGLSRVLDYLQTDPAVDGKKVALAGVSRLGKTVLWAAAQDQRFAMVLPLLSGEGGAAISRRNFGETIADLTNPKRYHYWYAPRYADYAFDVDALPVDGNLLVSLIAPRPILLVVGSSDTWSDPKGEWVSAKSAESIYQLYGLTGPQAEEYPKPDTFLPGQLGFFIHEGGHVLLPKDLEVMTDFMDQHLK